MTHALFVSNLLIGRFLTCDHTLTARLQCHKSVSDFCWKKTKRLKLLLLPAIFKQNVGDTLWPFLHYKECNCSVITEEIGILKQYYIDINLLLNRRYNKNCLAMLHKLNWTDSKSGHFKHEKIIVLIRGIIFQLFFLLLLQ